METLLTIVHIFVAFVLIIAVLLQAGKGGGMGATFGGASQEIFGGRGAGNFLTKITTLAAVIFFMTSLSLSMMSSQNTSAVGDALKTEAEAEAAAAVEVKAEEAPKADTNAEAVKAEEAPAEEVKAEEAPAADANAEAVKAEEAEEAPKADANAEAVKAQDAPAAEEVKAEEAPKAE